MTASTNDTQRELEQRALRNVRGLVDKIEATQGEERRLQRRTLALLVAIALLLALGLGYTIWRENPRHKEPVVIDPAKLPPVRAGPGKPS